MLSGAFENDDSRILIRPQLHDGVIKTFRHFHAHGVHDFGAVEYYGSDITLLFYQKMI
jgi:hypothetical protein